MKTSVFGIIKITIAFGDTDDMMPEG